MTMKYPVLLIELNPSHADFARGRRFAVEQADHDLHTFQTLSAAQAFMREHDLIGITESEMNILRAAHTAADDNGGD